MSDPIVPGLATITSLTYANTLINAQLEFIPSRQVTAGLFQRTVTGTPLVTGTNNGGAVTMFYNGTLDPGVVYYVALTFDAVNGPWGLPVALVWQQPTLVAASVDTNRIAVSWSNPQTTTISAVRASLYDATAEVQVVTGVFTGTGAQLVPAMPLNPAGDYTIVLAGASGIATGPQVSSAKLSFASPSISAASYAWDGRATYSITVTLTGAPPSSGSVVVRLLRDDVAVQSQTAANSPVVFNFQTPLDPQSNWQLDAHYVAGGIAGPSALRFGLDVPEVPPITSLFYAGGSIIVGLAATAQPGATVALFKGEPTGKAWISSGTTQGSSANLSVDPSVLQPGSVYDVALTLDANADPVIWGTPATLVWQQPTLAFVGIVNGAVEIAWTLPVQTTIKAVNASLYDGTAKVTVAGATFTGSGGRLVPATALDPTHSYTVSIAGVNAVASSAATTSSALILVAPAVGSATYAAGSVAGTYQITATPTSQQLPAGDIVGQLLADDLVVATEVAAAGKVTFARTGPLDRATTWKVALLLRSGLVSGPSGVAVAIPLTPPELTSAVYDGSVFDVAWRGAAGAVVTIVCEEDKTVVGTSRVDLGFSTKVTPDHAIDTAKTYTINLAPFDGTAQGLAGPKTTLIVAAPVLASVASNGAQVAVMFAQVDAKADASELLIAVDSGSILSAPAGPKGGYAELPRGAVTGLRVAARAMVGSRVAGPASADTAVLVATPSISAVSFGGTAVTGTVTAPSGVTLTSPTLTVTLTANGIPVGKPVSANSDGTFSVPTAGTAGSAFALSANLSGQASSVAVTGPNSTPIPVLTDAPRVAGASLVQTDVSAWRIEAAWGAPAGPSIGSYKVTLAQGGSVLKSWTATGTTLSETAATFDAARAVTLTVTPLGNYGSGPASATMTFLPSAIASVSARVDGSVVTAVWTANSTAGTPTAFRLRLLESVAGTWALAAQSEAVTATTASVALPASALNATAAFAVAVDVACGDAWVMHSPGHAIVTTAPVLTSAVTGSGGSVAVAWTWSGGDAPHGIDGYLPVVLWDGNETALPKLPATPLNASVAIPATIPGGASIALRALAGDITGPAGRGVPLVLRAPAGAAVLYDGSNVAMSWDAAEDGRVNAYKVTFQVSGQTAVVETVGDTTWHKAFTPTQGQSATLSVVAVAGTASSPATATIDAVLDAPAVTGARADGTTLALKWTAASSAAAKWTVISVLSGGKLCRQITSGGSSATLELADGPFTIQLQGAGPATLGPSSPVFTPITAAPVINAMTFSVLDRGLTLGWSVVDQAAAYQVAFRHATGVIEKQAGTNSLVIAAADLPLRGVYDLTVRALGSASSTAVAGPVSASAPLVLMAPASVDVAYDGRKARVSWSPLAAREVTGYVVTLLDGSTIVSSPTTTETSLEVAAPYQSTKDYQVVVQALTGAGGALPSPAASAFGSGWYPSTSTTQPPAIKPFATSAMTPSDIVVNLPNIFTTYVTTGLPSQPPFALATTSQAPFGYTLTMSASSIVWNFDAKSRQDVFTAYTTLLNGLMPLGLTPLGWRVVQDAIARAMPQTFAETLSYAHGFDPANGAIDLKPGMVLRLDQESYQYLGRDQTMSRYLDGFVGSESVQYDIGSYVAGSTWLTGFDAFLSTIMTQGSSVPAPMSDGSNQSGGGGIADLYWAQLRKPFLRLVYPVQLLASGESDARPAFNVAILAAGDYPTLITATANLRNGRALGPGVFAAYLRGRATLTACVRFRLNGQPTVVPLGTTVGNVLEQMGSRPPIFPAVPPSTTPGIPISGLTLGRARGYAITDARAGTDGYAVGALVPIKLDWAGGMAYGPSSDWLDLPLLGGDELRTAGRG